MNFAHKFKQSTSNPKPHPFSQEAKDLARSTRFNTNLINNKDNNLQAFFNLHHSNGKLCKGISVDITAHKKVEASLLESNAKYQALVAQSLDGITISDENGNIAIWNKSMEVLTGIPACDAFGKPFWEIQLRLIPDEQKTPEFVEQLKINLKNIIESKIDGPGESREQTIMCPDGTRKTVQDSSFVIKTGNTVRIGAILHDITKRKKIEHDLSFKNILFEAQMESTLDGILIVDGKGKTISSNQLFASMFGIPTALLDSHDDKKMLDFVTNQFKDPDLFISTTKYAYSNPYEFTRDELQFKNGNVFDRYSSPLINKLGVLGRIWYFRDITARKIDHEKLQKALLDAEKANMLKNKFLNIVAHDLRSPFNGMLGFIELALEEAHKPNADIKELVA